MSRGVCPKPASTPRTWGGTRNSVVGTSVCAGSIPVRPSPRIRAACGAGGAAPSNGGPRGRRLVGPPSDVGQGWETGGNPAGKRSNPPPQPQRCPAGRAPGPRLPAGAVTAASPPSLQDQVILGASPPRWDFWQGLEPRAWSCTLQRGGVRRAGKKEPEAQKIIRNVYFFSF